MTRLGMDALDLYLLEASTAIHILVCVLRTVKIQVNHILLFRQLQFEWQRAICMAAK